MKCRYKYCKHQGEDVAKENAVKVGSLYFHKDCFKERKEKDEIFNLFLEKVNKNAPYTQLRKVINVIINDKGVDSEFLLFGLKYYINHKIKLNYPGGLFYVVANKDVESEYKKLHRVHYDFDLTEDADTSFVYSRPRKKSIDNFMEG